MVAQYWGKPSGLVLLLVGLPELSLVCILQGVWTDGKLVASVGLDQRLRTWNVNYRTGSGDSTVPGVGDATSCGVTFIESSDRKADACALVLDAQGMAKASVGGLGSEQDAAAASTTGASSQAEVASSCSQMSVRETGSIVLQVLEPSALHVSRTGGDLPAWTVAVVGRGTQIVLCYDEGGI